MVRARSPFYPPFYLVVMQGTAAELLTQSAKAVREQLREYSSAEKP